MSFVDQDDSASGGNPQTMRLVRIKQLFIILLCLFQVQEMLCLSTDLVKGTALKKTASIFTSLAYQYNE